MIDVSNKVFIDGADLWTAFSIIVESGSADFLRYAPKKDSIQHDWIDTNGIDVDLSRYVFKERTGTLRCAIITASEAEFFAKHDAFIATLTQPGSRRLQFTSHGDRQYNVFYRETNNYDQVKALRGDPANDLIAHRFGLVLTEAAPGVNSDLVYIVDDDGRFIVT